MSASSWAIVALARKLGDKLERDWHAIPAAQRGAWARALLLGVMLVLVALYAAIALIKLRSHGTNHFAWESALLRAVENGPVGFSSAVWLQTFGTDFMLLFVVMVSAGLAVWNDRPLLAITVVLSVLLMDAIVRIGWFFFARERPDIIAQGLAAPGFHSFPSGHTAKTVALYGLLAAQWMRASANVVEKIFVAMLALLIFVVVPYGRVRMGAHWPTDIVGGWLIGGVWLACALRALRHERYAEER